MNNTKMSNEILVLGGTGKTGSRVAARLLQAGYPVRIGSRTGKPCFDWENRSTWDAVLHNVGAVYISYHPDLAIPGTAVIIREFVAAAVAHKVQRLVLLSGRGEAEAQECEEIVMHSGLEWTVVRASWFCQNFSEGAFLEPILAGHVALPAGDIGEPFVDADDIAEVAAVSLTEDGHQGKIYELTGPQLLTFSEAVAEIAKATGRKITFETIPMESYAAAMREFQVPENLVWLLTYLFTEVLDGRNAMPGDGVLQALGRKPASFSEYARKAALSGVWEVQEAFNTII
jgi:uncharacterized protein YbjT (DUF2867 family)